MVEEGIKSITKIEGGYLPFDPTPRIGQYYGPNSLFFWTDAQRQTAANILWGSGSTPNWKAYNEYWKTQAPVNVKTGEVGSIGKYKQVVDNLGNPAEGYGSREIYYDVETKTGAHYKTRDPTGAPETPGWRLSPETLIDVGYKNTAQYESQSNQSQPQNTSSRNPISISKMAQPNQQVAINPSTYFANPSNDVLGKFGAIREMRPRSFSMSKPKTSPGMVLKGLSTYANKRSANITQYPVDVKVSTRKLNAKAELIGNAFPPKYSIVLSKGFYQHNKHNPKALHGAIMHEIAHIEAPFNHGADFKNVAKHLRIPKRYRGKK